MHWSTIISCSSHERCCRIPKSWYTYLSLLLIASYKTYILWRFVDNPRSMHIALSSMSSFQVTGMKTLLSPKITERRRIFYAFKSITAVPSNKKLPSMPPSCSCSLHLPLRTQINFSDRKKSMTGISTKSAKKFKNKRKSSRALQRFGRFPCQWRKWKWFGFGLGVGWWWYSCYWFCSGEQ